MPMNDTTFFNRHRKILIFTGSIALVIFILLFAFRERFTERTYQTKRKLIVNDLAIMDSVRKPNAQIEDYICHDDPTHDEGWIVRRDSPKCYLTIANVYVTTTEDAPRLLSQIDLAILQSPSYKTKDLYKNWVRASAWKDQVEDTKEVVHSAYIEEESDISKYYLPLDYNSKTNSGGLSLSASPKRYASKSKNVSFRGKLQNKYLTALEQSNGDYVIIVESYATFGHFMHFNIGL